MYAIVRKAYHFIEDEIVEHAALGSMRKIVKEIKIAANTFSQELPDWVKDTELYQLAVDDGFIEETVPKKAKKEDEKTPEKQPAPSGFGAPTQPVNTGFGLPPANGNTDDKK